MELPLVLSGENTESSTNLSALNYRDHLPLLISLDSFYNKTQEFRTWLLEERKINPEAISKDQERKEFAVFVEDYNTGTCHWIFSCRCL